MSHERGTPPLPKRVRDLERAQSESRIELRKIKDVLSVKDNSVGVLSSWLNSKVQIDMINGVRHIGVLAYYDKYNLGVRCEDQGDDEEPSIIPKSNIARIRLREVTRE